MAVQAREIRAQDLLQVSPVAAAKRSKTKAAKPSHVKPLDSVRWQGVRFSSGTEKRLKESYAKRKTSARKKSGAAGGRAPKSKGPTWVQVNTSNKYGETGWVQVDVASLLTSKPQNIWEITGKVRESAAKAVGHPVSPDSDLAQRVAKSLGYLEGQGIAERSMRGAFSAFSKKTAKKAAEPKLSEKTNRKISEAYTARKTRKLRNTRASRWTVEDMRHVAEIGMKFAKSSELPAAERAVIDKVKIEAGRHPGFSRYLYARYDVYRGPKAFLSVQFPNPDGVTEMGRHVLPGQFYVQAFIRRAGKDETMHEGYHTGAGELDLIAADLLRKLARVAKK